MKKNCKTFIVCLLSVSLLGAVICGCNRSKTEAEQPVDEMVSETEMTEEDIIIEEFENNLAQAEITEDTLIEEQKDRFEYVALGNSVTCNVTSELWWGNWGMAATSPEKDYVHRITRWLEEEHEKDVSTTVINIKNWEVASKRNKKLEKYREYFTEETDLVTIQTGENIVNNKENLASDYTNLLKMIKEQAPNAQILMLGEVLWPSEDIEAAKQSACEECGATFVKTRSFLKKYDTKFKSAVGIKVKGADGKKHKIENETVAAHPNNAGMKKIANLFIKHIEIE